MQNSSLQFIDSNVFGALVRPQYPAGCSIASITSCLSYFKDSEIQQTEVAENLGLDIKSKNLGPGNMTISEWIESLHPEKKSESKEAWSEELKKRIDRYEQGESSAKPWADVKKNAQALLDC